ncbi:MAG TPA: DUF61 family protein [Methanoregulaceae archaeon]|nr:DUF61 family protein [Methanoregulaceae archaeon]
MNERPTVSDEAVMRRWMGLELRRMNDAIVADRKTLIRLLEEKRPSARTKGGDEYVFDLEVLRGMASHISPEIQRRLRLPILFYFDSTVSDSCFLSDETAVRALQELGEISHLREMNEGRLWIGKPIVFAIAGKYRKAVQIVMR